MTRESPLPKHPDLFGSFPSAAAGDKYAPVYASTIHRLILLSRPRKKVFQSPSAPARAADYKILTEFDIPGGL